MGGTAVGPSEMVEVSVGAGVKVGGWEGGVSVSVASASGVSMGGAASAVVVAGAGASGVNVAGSAARPGRGSAVAVKSIGLI